ncbi:unnamed protein product, partial [Acanthoscelides obtectus]
VNDRFSKAIQKALSSNGIDNEDNDWDSDSNNFLDTIRYGMQHPRVHLKIFITPIALAYRLLATLLKKFQDAYGTI